MGYREIGGQNPSLKAGIPGSPPSLTSARPQGQTDHFILARWAKMKVSVLAPAPRTGLHPAVPAQSPARWAGLCSLHRLAGEPLPGVPPNPLPFARRSAPLRPSARARPRVGDGVIQGLQIQARWAWI